MPTRTEALSELEEVFLMLETEYRADTTDAC
jgi:hypothetical protein